MVIILATGHGIIVTKCERWNSWGFKLMKKKNKKKIQPWIPSILFWTVCSWGIHHNNNFNEIVPICPNGPFHTKIRSNLKQIFFYIYIYIYISPKWCRSSFNICNTFHYAAKHGGTCYFIVLVSLILSSKVSRVL